MVLIPTCWEQALISPGETGKQTTSHMENWGTQRKCWSVKDWNSLDTSGEKNKRLYPRCWKPGTRKRGKPAIKYVDQMRRETRLSTVELKNIMDEQKL